MRWFGSVAPGAISPVCAEYVRCGERSNNTTLRLGSIGSAWCSNSRRTSVPPWASNVAFITSVVTLTCVLGAGGAAGGAAGTAPGVATAAGAGVVAGAGTAVAAGGAAGAVVGAVGRGPKIDGSPWCLFQASHSRTSDIENTTHSRVRRISVMERSSVKGCRPAA